MSKKRLLLYLYVAWFLGIVIIFFISGNRSAAVFAFLYAIVYGGICYRYRDEIRTLLNRIPAGGAIKFFGLAFLVTAAEEVFCYLLGNHVALPVLWQDVLFCGLIWFGWFGTWYFYLSKHYRYSEPEALLAAGFSGILYETTGNGMILSNPLAVLLVMPFLVLVYSAIFILPMQLIDFTGTKEGLWKYPVSIVLPFIASLPIAIGMFLLFTLLGVPVK